MKIIQVIPFLSMGGAEIMCENLVYELKKLGHEVIIVSLYNKKTPVTERIEESGIEIKYLDKKGGIDFSMFGKLKKLFKKEKPDVIHTHLYVTKYVFPVAAKMKIKVIHTLHSIATEENAKLTRKLNNIYFKRQSAIPVALSQRVQDTIIDEYGLSRDFVPVIFNGIDLNKCKIKKDYSRAENFKILHIGSFLDVKNHKGLIEAFSKFNKNHPSSQLYLIGYGALMDETKDFVDQIGMQSAVTFLGMQSDVHKYISDMDVFTLPSKYEGIPMTLIEAMGSGMPIVATMVGGIPDMLDDESALLVPVETDAIADAFEKYYLNEDLRRSHGSSALKLAERFSAETMAKRYLEIY